jgi:cell division protein FtsX
MHDLRYALRSLRKRHCLLLMRAMGRRHELAIRASVGADRGCLVRQLFVEGAVLSAFGAASGIAFAIATWQLLLALCADQISGTHAAVLHQPYLH